MYETKWHFKMFNSLFYSIVTFYVVRTSKEYSELKIFSNNERFGNCEVMRSPDTLIFSYFVLTNERLF